MKNFKKAAALINTILPNNVTFKDLLKDLEVYLPQRHREHREMLNNE